MVSMGLNINNFDNYILSIHTINDVDQPGYKIQKVIECYRASRLIAHLTFSEGQSGQQNSFASPKAPALYMFYFDMNLFDEVYNLIRHDRYPTVAWDDVTEDGSVRSHSQPVGQ
jgi:hypothetical protein